MASHHGPARMKLPLRDLAAQGLRFFRTPTFGRRMTALTAVGFGLLLLTAVSSLVVSQRMDDLFERVDHTFEVRRTLADLEQAVADAESHQRGFLVTGQPALLNASRAARDDALRSFERLRDLTFDNPDQTERLNELRPILDRRFEVIEQSLIAGSSGQVGQAIGIVRRGEGIVAMTELRRRLTNFDAIEAGLQADRQAAARNASTWNFWINVVGTALIIGIAAACLVMQLRYLRDIQVAQAELDRLNRGLEDQVRDRTADLTRANEEIQRFAYIVRHDLRSPLVNDVG